MSILDMFKSAPAPVVPAVVPPNQGNIPAAPTIAVDPNNPTAPVAPVASVVEDKPDTPLDPFNKLWENVPNESDKNAPAAPAELTQEAVQKIVAKTDFSKIIPQENLTAIAAGGDEAMTAFSQAMNAVAQQVMVQSTMVNNKLNQQAIATAVEKHSASLPAMLREQAASNHLNETNPLFSNPAVKPVIEATQAQLLQKHPNATHAEITKMTQDYIIAMGQSFAPQPVVNNNSGADTDWSEFF